MQIVKVCLLLIFVFIISGDVFAFQNSCQHGITIKFIPQSRADIKDDINIINIETSGSSLAPNMISEGSLSLNLYRLETSGYLGKITAELDKCDDLDLTFAVSCDSPIKPKREWKKLNTFADNILSGIKNNRNIQNSIYYEVSIPDHKIIAKKQSITIILTILDDENLYNQALLPQGFYSYKELN